MTLISELIEIPDQVHKSDFVISLKSAIDDPPRTIADYVVTDQLATSFDRALSLITSAVADQRSKSSYLHASFGAGKSAFMAVTHLLLQGEPAARAKPELAPIVAKYANRIDGRSFLLVPYQAVGATSMEQVVLGGYVDHLRTLHPEADVPAVYVSDNIVADAQLKRAELGDETFFRVLSDGDAADEWGDYGAGWDAARFDAAVTAAPGTSEHDQLVSALLRTHYRAVPGQASATAEGFVPLDDGLEAISRHAAGLGYDAVVMFLDELVLWLASRAGDTAFVAREGAKVVKLVEGDAAARPAPIVSLIARQRDLRELVGEHVPGVQSLSAIDVLRHSEGRFDTITLEDRNLPAIAEQRLLRPRSEAARQALDDAFDAVQRELDQRGDRDVLLTDSGDLTAFRRLYPFSPALVDALVALSGAMQRERTALKVMLQLLVDNRDRLQVGQLVPLGDLFDAIDTGDEPLTEVMRSQFHQARRLWDARFRPVLQRDHGLTADEADAVPAEHPFVIDARLVKSLLVAALVPEVAPLRDLTVSRLTALNSGIVRAFVPGTERQQVLDKLRGWASEIGELRLGDDEHDPTVSLTLTGIDTGPILDAAKQVDSDGDRRRRVKELLVELLQVRDAGSFEPWFELTWRGTPRQVDVVFGNVRDSVEVPDERLRAGTNPKLVIDYPWDTGDYGPHDDRARIDQHRQHGPAEWTAVWLPNFLTATALTQLGRLVRLDYVLTGDTFDRFAGHLSPSERPLARAQLANEQAAVRERLVAVLRQAYGVDQIQPNTVDDTLAPGDQFASLDPAMQLRPPVGTTLRSFAEGIADQLHAHRFPRHPDFAERVTTADLRHTLTQVTAALGQPGGRLENVDPTLRKVLAKVAGPLQLGQMHAAHFIADVQHWTDLIERRRAEAGLNAITVGDARRWLDGADTPDERRGLTPEVADLVVLAVCAATGRSLVAVGRPVAAPEIGRLRDDWELRAQELPSDDDWETALTRAGHMGIVPASSLRSATAVAELDARITEMVTSRADPIRLLDARLPTVGTVVDVPADSDRAQTARAAVRLLDELGRRPGHAVAALAELDIPTSAAALGTSIEQAAAVAAAVQDFNVSLVQNAIRLGGANEADAQRIAQRLAEAAAADELTIGLVERLRDAEHAATDLLSRAATAGRGSDAESTAEPDPEPDAAASRATPPADPEERRQFVREQAEAQLATIRARLRAEAELELRWEIEAADGDG